MNWTVGWTSPGLRANGLSIRWDCAAESGIGVRQSISTRPERRSLSKVELPGVNPEAVEVTLAGHMLTVVAAIESPADDGEVRRQERPRGRFKRAIPLPVSVDPENVEADSKHGLLRVTVNKTAAAKEKRVPVAGRHIREQLLSALIRTSDTHCSGSLQRRVVVVR